MDERDHKAMNESKDIRIDIIKILRETCKKEETLRGMSTTWTFIEQADAINEQIIEPLRSELDRLKGENKELKSEIEFIKDQPPMED